MTVGEINLHLQLTPTYRRDIFADEQVKELTKIYFLEKAKKLGIIIVALDFGPDHFHAFITNWKKYSVEKLVNEPLGSSREPKIEHIRFLFEPEIFI